jgi:carbon monoxide dehydrogenase subunit G
LGCAFGATSLLRRTDVGGKPLTKITTTVKLSFKVNKNIDLVFDYLTDMQKFVSVHPVISKIDKTSDKNYIVHETLKFGAIPFSFTYPVTIENSISDKIVIIKATVFRLAKIEMKFFLKADNSNTIIDEEIHFNSPLPALFIMKRVFREQHEKLFKNINAN